MPAERPILIIDDDSDLCAALVEQLAVDPEFHPVAAASLHEADEHLGSETVRFRTVILDVTLPDGDGCDYCAKLRRQGHRMPIIMLTGSDREMDVVRGLDAGANDYIAKPFRVRELMARIRTQLRGFETSEDAVFTIGPYLFRPSARSLYEPVSDRRIHLTAKEVALLRCLLRVANRVVDRRELLNRVWGYHTSATTHTLETHVYRLRQRMEWDPNQPRLLVTHGRGYCLRLDADSPEPGADHAAFALRRPEAGSISDRPPDHESGVPLHIAAPT
jgi:DNA-binding response OmpR family regulator